MRLLLAVLLSTLCTISSAETYVQINGVSVHDQPGFNSLNYGLGIEHQVTTKWNVAVGWYRNSEYSGSAYAYGRYALWRSDGWDLGIAAGAVTGYNRASVMPLLFPELCYQWMCSLFIPQVDPAGANALGFHIRLPIN